MAPAGSDRWSYDSPVVAELACPRCGGELARAEQSLTCLACGAHYPIANDVPVLIADALSAQHEHQRRYFDAEFGGYDRYVLENWRLSFIERIFASIGVLDGGAPYLDAGVGGSGATVIEAARQGVPSVGFDLSVEGVVAARRHAREEGVEGMTTFVVASAEALPFADAQFGSASAVALLEHLDDDRSAVAELARVMRPGALLWLTVPHSFRHMPLPVWPFFWWHDRRIGHKRHYDEGQLVQLCADAGLVHVRTSYSAHWVKIVQFVGTRLIRGMGERGSSAWWRLERLDRRAEGRRRGAIQLSAVFRRPVEPPGDHARLDAGA
jgi:ubiquinone/menaquinone biosynthesis C-methylase UbiE